MQISIIAQVQPFVNLGCRFRVRPGADAWPCVETPGYPPGIPAAPPYPLAIDESGQGRVLVPGSAIDEKI